MTKYGTAITITDAMINRGLDDKVRNRIERLLVDALVEKLFVDGQRAVSVRHVVERVESIPGVLDEHYVETLDDPRLVALVARQEARMDRLLGTIFLVNDLSWWRWLWLKLRRRPIVTAS